MLPEHTFSESLKDSTSFQRVVNSELWWSGYSHLTKCFMALVCTLED
ncbi:rCG58877 [Rattus norvegicus]|uniref:RCG58877 n=1 Tax=Rattus norvegicus TaxID=10116 RepID=A6KRN4_RAT|nr:rCG58877 [Rattus norvegicus]